jgi:gamma-glutamyl hydrolase
MRHHESYKKYILIQKYVSMGVVEGCEVLPKPIESPTAQGPFWSLLFRCWAVPVVIFITLHCVYQKENGGIYLEWFHAGISAPGGLDHHKGYKTMRPLIGILSQGGPPGPSGSSYIASSYIKFVESAGARAVPILVDMSMEDIRRRFEAVNGILIPGGGQELSPGHAYYDAVKILFDLTIEENKKGVHFPLHGTCLGFEALAVAAAGNASVLATFDAEDYAQPLYPTEHAEKSRFFNNLPVQVVDSLYTKAVAMENHMHGVLYRSFAENPPLDEFFRVLTLSNDRKKILYVSTMEAKEYPISATQWHPEKNAFEWTRGENIPHDLDAVLVTQAVANSFVNSARRNGHAPKSIEEEEELLIYNWSKNIVYTGKHAGKEQGESSFDQIYVFPSQKQRSLSL